jgi:hypothetical protein
LLALKTSPGEDFQHLLIRFTLERLLYRLSVSPFAEQFVLKGAMLFVAWEACRTGRHWTSISSAMAIPPCRQ